MTTGNENWQVDLKQLDILAPLIGQWKAKADTPKGPAICTRIFTPILNGKFVQLTAHWEYANDSLAEHAIIGVAKDELTFWSFTSDGEYSSGTLMDGSDIHPEAICFSKNGPEGAKRIVYWPDGNSGYYRKVEKKDVSGWQEVVLHHYRPVHLTRPDYSILD